MITSEYWFDEGAYAYKAGINLDDLNTHFPNQEMTTLEWGALERGWMTMEKQYLETMGQIRLFQ